MAGKTVAERNKELEAQLAEQARELAEEQQLRAAAEARAEDAEGELQDLASQIPAQTPQVVDASLDGEPVVLHDPFDVQNPHKFKAHPPGYRLGWINPTYRDGHRMWRGWDPVTFDDDVGQHLERYLQDPPRKMSHQTDNLIRRGDVILCRLDISIWNARQQKRTRKSALARQQHAQDLQADPRPKLQRDQSQPRIDSTHQPGRVMTGPE